MFSPVCGCLLALVAQCVVIPTPLGAPDSIELFHPEMPQAPAPFLPSRTARTEAVPVIHLDTHHNGKASVDAYLDMFPSELLSSNKKVKPIDVRKIEHEDFIDYEIEFLELSEETDDDEIDQLERNTIPHAEGDILNSTMLSADDKNEVKSDGESPAKSSRPSVKSANQSKEMNLVTFVDLLRRARIKHQKKSSSDNRRRRRIKLKRDPLVNTHTDETDSSNHIDTNYDVSQEKKRYRFQKMIITFIFSLSFTVKLIDLLTIMMIKCVNLFTSYLLKPFFIVNQMAFQKQEN